MTSRFYPDVPVADRIEAINEEMAVHKAVLARYPLARRCRLWENGPVVFAVFDAFPTADQVLVVGEEIYAYHSMPWGDGKTVSVFRGVGLEGPRPAFVALAFDRLKKDNPEAYAALLQAVARENFR